MMRWIATFCLCLSLLTLVGCNTLHGFGKDVEKGGQKIQEKTAPKATDW